MDTSFAEREAQRLKALHQLHILDTPDEAAFDRITELAATLFEVPLTLVSLIDENRQWFKSCYGEELLGVRETGRDVAFCAHAVEEDRMLVVPDATQDARFASNPLVTQAPHIRFYAGGLLKSRAGFNLGTLCLVDFVPREFGERERDLLQKLAAIASEEIERRHETQDARSSENRLRTLVDSTSDIITILAPDGTIRYESAALTRVLGYTPQELEGHHAFEFVHPDDVPLASEAFRRALDDPAYSVPVEFRFRHRDGSWRVLEAGGRNRVDDADIGGIVLSSRDVTEREKAQSALRDSEEQLRLALDAGQMGVWRVDLRTETASWSPQLEAMHGLPPGGYGGSLQRFLQCVHPDDRAQMRGVVPQVIETRRECRTEYRTLWPDGTLRWIESRANPFFDNNGQPTYILGVSLDITERKDAEAELREEAAHLAALSAAQNAIAVADLDLAHVMERITQRVMALTRAEGVAILSINGDELMTSAGAGLCAPHVGERVALRSSLSGQSALDNCVLRCDDIEVDPRVDREGCRRAGARSLLAAPLRHHEQTTWVLLMVSSRPHAFSERDEQTLDLLRGLCASVISRTVEGEAKRAALEALSQSEKRKAAIVETALDCIISIDGQSRVIEWNPAAEKTFGFEREAALGQHLYDLIIPPELREGHRKGLGKYLQTGEGPILDQRLELPAVRADGRRITVELAIVSIPDIEPPIFTGHLRDITERRQNEQALRESEARYSRIAANVPGMIYQFVLRPDGSVYFPFVGQGCREIYEMEPQEIERDATSIMRLTHPADRARFQESIAHSAQTFSAWAWEGRVVLPSGEERWIQGASRPKLEDNGDILWDGLLLDITQRKQTETALQAAKEEAERANAAKSEFLSRMSHELRTPLNAILGFGQLLEMAELPEEDRESVEQIVRAGRHLLELINEVLDIARIESGNLRLSLEAVSLGDAAIDTLDLVRPLAQERSISLLENGLRDCGLFVEADHQRFRQVLLNLLANAIKYNRNGGAVKLHWEETQGRLRLGVQDNGPGIAPDKMSRLFTPFDRLGAESGTVEGTGIGLALCKRLIELMGGSIGAHSILGEGSTFWVELPLAQLPQQFLAPEDDKAEVERAITTRWVVLYIEDNLSNLQLLQRLLARRPEIKLLSAMQGSMGLELAQQHQPHLILLDLHLPQMDGDEVLRRLQANPETRDIPVIVLSADATPHQVERMLQIGARAYLTKPFNIGAFMQLLNDNLPAENLIAGKTES